MKTKRESNCRTNDIVLQWPIKLICWLPISVVAASCLNANKDLILKTYLHFDNCSENHCSYRRK